MFQVLEGIIKVINPQGKAVIGVADGKGLFIWLGADKILASFPPKPYVNWQTTRFLLDLNFKVNWKPERNWEQYRGSYTAQNILPIPSPIPAEYAIEPLLSVSQAPVVGFKPVPPIIQPTEQYITPISGSAVTPQPPIISFSNTPPDYTKTIADELTKIRKLIELYIKPSNLVTADTLVISEDQVIDEYGEPPEEKLPDVF